MGPIYGPSEGSIWVIVFLVLCGIVGLAYGGYELVVYILQHIHFV